jgi:uncharacterized protein YcnI
MHLSRKALATLTAVSALAIPAAASAHVVVSPGKAAPGSFVTFTMSVPNEKEIPTTRVRLAIPKGVTVYSVEAVPGWEWQVTRAKGRITRLTVTGSLPAGYFQRFAFVGAVPEKPAVLVWRAFQTYEDGSVVRWVGPPNADLPASRTVVGRAKTGNASHGHGG